MVSNPPKVSFIPKSPLSREESFMERRRPRSITGFFAIFAFVVSVGSYAGLYFYEDALSKEVATKAKSITDAQREFLQAPEISKAKVFKARAELARELLDQHIAVSPVFAFLSNSTLGSILYDSFSFKRENGVGVLSLTGEAPSYATLAYQTDVLRKKSKENEFVDFSVSHITLTKSGTVTFDLSVDFAQSQLSYTKESTTPEVNISTSEVAAPGTPPETINSSPEKGAASSVTPSTMVFPTVQPASRTATVTPELPTSVPENPAASGWTVAPVSGVPAVPQAVTPTPAPLTKTSSFWSWFKFW